MTPLVAREAALLDRIAACPTDETAWGELRAVRAAILVERESQVEARIVDEHQRCYGMHADDGWASPAPPETSGDR